MWTGLAGSSGRASGRRLGAAHISSASGAGRARCMLLFGGGADQGREAPDISDGAPPPHGGFQTRTTVDTIARRRTSLSRIRGSTSTPA